MSIKATLITLGITAIFVAAVWNQDFIWSEQGDLIQCPHPRYLAKHWCQALPPPSSTKALVCYEDRLRIPGAETSRAHFFMGPTEYNLNDDRECEAIIPQVGYFCQERFWNRECRLVGKKCYSKHDPISGHFDPKTDIFCV